MNSAFVGYKELCRSRRVLSAEVDNIPLDLHNSSYPTQPNSLIVNSTEISSLALNPAPATQDISRSYLFPFLILAGILKKQVNRLLWQPAI